MASDPATASEPPIGPRSIGARFRARRGPCSRAATSGCSRSRRAPTREALYAESHPPAADPDLWAYLPSGPYRDVAAFRDDLAVAERSEDPLFFTLARLPEEHPAGIASYLRITPEHGSVEIGHIWFGASLRQSTAASEAIYLLAAYAFDELGYRRLEWKCNALNQASRRAAERFGFRFEGVFRQHMVVKGRNRDTAWYSITDGEWPLGAGRLRHMAASRELRRGRTTAAPAGRADRRGSRRLSNAAARHPPTSPEPE